MKNLACLFLILFAVNFVFGQKTFEVQNFSADYYGKVYVAQPSETFSSGWIAILDKKTNKELIKVNSEQLAIEVENEKVKANVKELPYGEQSVIIHDDFNFDGIKDFAIEDGQNSCYGGPSFQIYLGSQVKSKFVLNPYFTKLAQEYCGMFEVDSKAKKLSTMTKSGCCWHQFSEYIVVNNKPKAIKIVEDDAMNFPFSTVTTGVWNGTKMVNTTKRLVDFENDSTEILFSFKTKKDNKEIVLFRNEDSLNYIIINNENVEFAFPKDSKQEDPKFTLDSKQNPTSLTFTNNLVTYKIYEENGKIGIQVNVKDSISDIEGDVTSKKGTLGKLIEAKLGNITFK